MAVQSSGRLLLRISSRRYDASPCQEMLRSRRLASGICFVARGKRGQVCLRSEIGPVVVY
jgi:hypothetical protein